MPQQKTFSFKIKREQYENLIDRSALSLYSEKKAVSRRPAQTYPIL